MKTKMRRVAVLGLAILVWGATLATLRADERQKTTTVTGEIEVASLGDDGGTTSVHLHDREFGNILIASEGRGKELLERVGSFVRVTGQLTRVKEDRGFDYVLRVDDYVVLEAVEEEGHDPERDGDGP